MNRRLTPCRPQGTVAAPTSKSFAHRMLICAALASTPSVLTVADSNEDLEATVGCLTSLGVTVEKDGAQWTVTPPEHWRDGAVLDCGESGSTLRFLLPVVSSCGVTATFTGHGRLPCRPNDALLDVMKQHGAAVGESFPIRVSGRLTPGDYAVSGAVSSQYTTGLLLALSHLRQNSTLTVLPPVVSAPYLNITLDVLRRFGAQIERRDHTFFLSPSPLHGGCYTAEGDWSNAAALLACGMRVSGLNLRSAQGDRAFLDIAAAMGATVITDHGAVRLSKERLRGTKIDASNIPDLVPVLAALAATAEGTTQIFGARRLRLKESDRLQSTASLLQSLGADVCETDDGLIIIGKPVLAGGTADSANDHRIVMAAAVAAQKCTAPVVIRNAQAIQKSFPTFFDLYCMQGGTADVQ